jgi:hypothetical protein
LNCKTLCGNKCHSRLHGLLQVHLNSLTCRRRKLYYGLLNEKQFFQGQFHVEIEPVTHGGVAIPVNGQLYVCIMNNSRSVVVKALREKVASLFEFLC